MSEPIEIPESVTWLFFDVGETLLDETDSYRQHFAACSLALARMGIQISADAYGELVRQAYVNGQSRPLFSVWTSLAGKAEKPKWQPTNEHLYPKTIETLGRLRERYQLAIIANQGEGLVERLRAAGIDTYFKLIISSSEVHLKKPDARIFELGLKKANITARQAALDLGQDLRQHLSIKNWSMQNAL